MVLVQVTELAEQDFTRISDGQRQRILLARAICVGAADSVIGRTDSYLDVKYKLEFLTTLQKLTRTRKLTVIMSLHELDLAQRISDKVMCIKGIVCNDMVLLMKHLPMAISVNCSTYRKVLMKKEREWWSWKHQVDSRRRL